ncbi:MAG: shikimate dehydrogenase [Rhizobacter sp.]|nr:shikimate dehydrogenase [Ferruginibacter sp.]
MNLFGLTGFPLGHSFSKEYFNNKFETEGLEDCFFELFPLKSIDEFPVLLKTQASLKGMAVTIPYKESIIPFLQIISGEAKVIGAVNCIEFLPEGLKGHNTDVTGFEKSFTPLLQPQHTRALILGTGGASKAVQYVLKKLTIPFLLVSRTPGVNAITYNEISEQLLKEYTIIINASPVGMSPHEDEAPQLLYEHIGPAHYLFDMIYKPAETKFLQQGKNRGAVIKNGYEMLLLQAEENWKIWNEL